MCRNPGSTCPQSKEDLLLAAGGGHSVQSVPGSLPRFQVRTAVVLARAESSWPGPTIVCSCPAQYGFSRTKGGPEAAEAAYTRRNVCHHGFLCFQGMTLFFNLPCDSHEGMQHTTHNIH